MGDTCSAAGACSGTARSCDDGVACNGEETCDGPTDKCLAGTPTCTGDTICDVTAKQCVATCTGCVIEGVCYGDGQGKRDNPCLKCDKASNASDWSNNNGAVCDDGKFCTVGDVCGGGICIAGTTRDCSDGVACNGVETCDPAKDKCVAAASTCPAGTACNVATDECTATCAGCLIDKICYGPGQTNPSNPCEECPLGASATAWSTKQNGASCGDGIFCNGMETCSNGACTAGGAPCNSGTSCVESKKACFMVGVDLCNADGDVIQYDDKGDATVVHDCVASSAHGTCVAGVCGCAEGYSGADCQSQDLPPSCLVHVRPSGNDVNDGSTWALAVATVHAGLNLAASKVSGSVTACEVWVATGVYKPTSGTDRSATFQLKASVGLYGGFAGTEVRRSQRDIEANPTALSGDIGAPGVKSDNSYHVVTGVTGGTIDGFTITAGHASGATPNDCGGGMYNFYSSPTVTNCTFSGNSVSFAAASYVSAYGGGMYNDNSSPTVTNCTFSGNSASAAAAAASSSSVGVSASANGGGMRNAGSSTTVVNSIFWGDSVSSQGISAASEFNNSFAAVRHSIVRGGYGGVGNLDQDPLLSPSDLHLLPGSPAIDHGTGCVSSVLATDQDGQQRWDIASVGNATGTSGVDIGAHEYQGQTTNGDSQVALLCTIGP